MNDYNIHDLPRPVSLSETPPSLVVLDQTLLPGKAEFLRLTGAGEIFEAIRSLRVRGAPAIGIAAAIGLYAIAANSRAADKHALRDIVRDASGYMKKSRPTAYNLFWALDRSVSRFESEFRRSETSGLIEALKLEALAIQSEDEENCRRIGENGLGLLKPGCGLLTHCNAGVLAASRYGTALAPIYVGLEKGICFDIYVDETRPLHQGSRLTAWELCRAGLTPTLICDNMAAALMSQGKIQAVLTGCDRVAKNGDAANKIGTLSAAVSARYFGIPFYICAPASTVDRACKTGGDIDIEIRGGDEITDKWFAAPMAPDGVKTYNMCFDITPHELITAFITERGVIYPPFEGHI